MSGAKVKVNVIRGFGELRVFYFFFGLAALSFLLYVFFIGQTVFRLVTDKNNESEKRLLASEISELELRSLSFNNQISVDKARELGFVEAFDTQFISQKDALTLR